MRDHVYLLQALQHRATRDNAEHYATFLDFAKAYDRVDQKFLFDVLAKMNIGPVFRTWVKLLYTKPLVHLLLSNALGPAIHPNRGTKQGCPLSCLLFDLYIEPLGDMLRAAPELGVPMPDGTRLTSVFFADDSTILSNSLESAEFQVDNIVGQFCAVSGAELNLDKCTTLVLNNAEIPTLRAGTPSLNLSPSGTPVRYLGAFLGHQLDPDYHVRLLHDKFLATLPQWQCRARTLNGRKVIANSLILSQIWHLTAVAPIPDTMVSVWQRLISNYVLGSRTTDDPKYRAHIHKMWHYDSRLGLGIPHIASKIRTQRLLLLQRLMRPSVLTPPPPWVPLVQQQFAQCLEHLYRPSHPFDFLWQNPHSLSAWIYTHELHPLWLDVWSSWSKMSLGSRLSIPPDLQTTLDLPLWDSIYPPFLDDSHKNAARLGSKCAIMRMWCLHGAANGFHSLRNFLRIGTNGLWPSFPQFLGHMSAGNRTVPVSMQHGQIQFKVVKGSRLIYDHFTRIWLSTKNLFNCVDNVQLQPDVEIAATAFTKKIKNAFVPFELWPKQMVKNLAYHAPLPSRDHPTKSIERPDYTAAKTYLRFVRKSLAVLTPVHADVWLRTIFCMLPVNSKFMYRQTAEPAAILCAHGCADVETQSHALFDCPKVFPLWETHRSAWRSIGARFSWQNLINIDKFSTHHYYARHKETLFQLWTMVTGVCIHLVWHHHNHVQYQGRTIPPPAALFEVSFLVWTATIRSWRRRLGPADSQADLTAALDLLLRQPHYRELRAKYPRCLDLQPTFDVH
jgi:hypothetical protein